MAKVEIITRCYNRLEYTVMCVRSINHKTDYKDYSHILIDQSSTDGTTEWINSLHKEGYYKIKSKINKTNSGDAGGMKDGYNLTDDDCKYIFQFDNDCVINEKGYLEKLVNIMDNDKKIGVIMLKRKGVRNAIAVSNVKKIDDLRFGEISHGTCCMMIRKDLLDKINIWYKKEKIGWGFAVTQKIKSMGYKVLKSLDVTVTHIDGYGIDDNGKRGQKNKYPYYIQGGKDKKKGTNFRKIIYK